MKNKRARSIVCMILLVFSFNVHAYANSAQHNWSGRDESGVMTTDGDCPIVVEHETLTFDLQEFPKYDYVKQEDIESYTGRLSAEYTFYNPSDMTITTRMAFPIIGSSYYGDYTDYTITANGKTVNAEIRHTLSKGNEEFSVEAYLPRLQDDYISDSFFTSGDLAVTKYTIKLPEFEGVDSKASPTMGIDVLSDLYKNTVLFFEGGVRQYKLDNGIYLLYTGRVKSGGVVEFYAIGQDPGLISDDITIYYDYKCEQVIAAGGIVSKAGTYTLNDLIFEDYDESSGISRVDWYNAAVTLLQEQRATGDPRAFIYDLNESNGVDPGMMVWYCYELTFAPGERITNVVSAPMYPDVNSWKDPTKYTYNYLLSPAGTWAEFGTLDIYINTPYYISNSSLDDFESTDNGYMLRLDSLPKAENGNYKELKFTLTSEEILDTESNQTNNALLKVGIVIGIVGAVAAIAILLLVIIRKKRKITQFLDRSSEETEKNKENG